MALVNQAKREINSKIVFFGPGLAGKASNLKYVYGKLKPEFRGVMKAMNVQEGRMLFFDFTPPGEGNVDGYRVRFHVYTVSGNVADAAAWKMVLKGVDGVVFVADSQPQRREANRQSLESLNAYLQGYGQSLSSLPVVFQFNKSDLPDAQDPAEMDRLLNPSGFPSFKASSMTGEGVLQSVLSLVKTVLTSLRNKGLEGISSGETLQAMVEPAAAAPPAGPAAAPAAPQAHEPAAEAPAPAWLGQPAQPEREVAPQVTAAAPLAAPPAAPESAGQETAEAGFGEAGGGETGFPAPVAPGAAAEPLSLELSGAPQPAGPGHFRLPLTIRSGSREKQVTLTIAISLEED